MPLIATVGPYVIDRELGRGGMGVVHAGHHSSTGVQAAIKTVTGAGDRRLFQIRREIDALARLKHPGIVRILDHGLDGGLPWYAMELLEGRTLEGFIRDVLRPGGGAGPAIGGSTGSADVTTALHGDSGTPAGADAGAIPSPAAPAVKPPAAGGRLAEAMGLMVRLCEILSYVHGEGVVHRDLKPANIFVSPHGLPVLVDFGLVTHVGGPSGRDVLEEAWVAGSCLFMAPEQIEGELLDPRTDLYALGCIMFLLLTGRPPFDGTQSEIILQHLNAARRPPSDFASGVPYDLDQLVFRLMAKAPSQRVGYADDVAALLRRMEFPAPSWSVAPPRSRTYLYRPPLVGRHDVLADVTRRVSGLADGHGGLVLLAGESGAGKTRLATEIAARAAGRGCQVTTGACIAPLVDDAAGREGSPKRGAPLHPLKPFLRAIADHCIAGGRETSDRIVGMRGPVLASYEPMLSGLPGQAELEPATPLPSAAAKARLFRYLADTFAEYATTNPTLVLVDDLQWADELTAELLEHMAAGPLAGMPIMVLGTFRSDESTDWLARLSDLDGVARLGVGRLPPDQVGGMVAGMLSLPSAPAAFVTFLAARTAGNPFFVAEYLRMAVAEQLVVRTPTGHWTFTESVEPDEAAFEALPLPQSLREVILRRLQTLSQQSTDVLRAAAVIGREFDLDVLRHVANVDDAQLSEALTELLDRGVVETLEQGGFTISHDKFREIPYGELDEAQRRRLHGRAAEAIDARPADGAPPPHDVLGRHWLEAGEPGRAAPLLERAGDTALSLYALSEAIGFYREVLSALTAAGVATGQAGVREKLADALALTGRHVDARREFDAALEALDAASVDAARIHRKCGKTLETEHDHATALERYARSEHCLDLTADRDAAWHREWIQVRLNRIWVYYWQARTDDMNALVALVEPAVHAQGSALQRSNYYQALVTRDYRQRRYVVTDDVIENGRRSLAAAEEAGAPVESAFARFVLGFGLLFGGRLDEAEAQLFEALQATRRLGDVTSELRCLSYLALTERRQGRVAQAETSAKEALALATATKMNDYVGLAQGILGWAALKGGDEERARELSQAALDAWGRLNFPYPFQWTAALTLLEVQRMRVPLRALVATAEPLLTDGQLRLPEPVNASLERAVAAYARHDAETTGDALDRAISEAHAAGFL